jgi:tetratricopeptide (TPR) repeat protein
MAHNIDPKLIVSNLIGISNAYWGQENLSQALSYAEQALTLSKSIKSRNDLDISVCLAVLANIDHKSDDDIRALELSKRALTLFERCISPHSPELASVLNNIGTIQISAGSFNDALLTFIRVLHIYEKTLPEGHPQRVVVENNIQIIKEMQQYNDVNSYSRLWTFLLKIVDL